MQKLHADSLKSTCVAISMMDMQLVSYSILAIEVTVFNEDGSLSPAPFLATIKMVTSLFSSNPSTFLVVPGSDTV